MTVTNSPNHPDLEPENAREKPSEASGMVDTKTGPDLGRGKIRSGSWKTSGTVSRDPLSRLASGISIHGHRRTKGSREGALCASMDAGSVIPPLGLLHPVEGGREGEDQLLDLAADAGRIGDVARDLGEAVAPEDRDRGGVVGRDPGVQRALGLA